MAGARWSIAQADLALVAATAKNILVLDSGTTTRTKIKKVWVDFDGVTAGNVQVLVEFYHATGTATDGTAITTNAAQLHLGNPTSPAAVLTHSVTTGISLGKAIEKHRWHPTTATTYEWALGDEPEIAPGDCFVIRCTAPNAVNVTFGCAWEE